jgi:hypothetical protein
MSPFPGFIQHTLSSVVAGCALALSAAALTTAHAASASVPYVPTPQNVVERMLDLGQVSRRDYLIDLGSGDGRIVVTAAKKHGARGYGVDLNPTRIAEANENARKAGVADKVAFYPRDLFETDLTPATVITMYLLPQVNLELRPKILQLRPGTRIVSHDFSMGDWKPDVHEQVEANDKYGGSGGRSDVYLWIVPARVAGSWQSQLQLRGKPVNYELALKQAYQTLTGSARVGSRSVPIQNGKIEGERVSFDFTAEVDGAPVKHHFSGRAEGDAIAGTADLSGAKLQSRMDWSASRAARAASAVHPSALRNGPAEGIN